MCLNAEVVCCTTTHCGAGSLREANITFRAVLIDEATQATEASALVALGRGALYFMCGKANGGDFKKSNVQTWRHAAGHDAKRWGEPSGVQGKELKREGKKWPVKAVYPRV